eukprot:ANDGO_00157.mRNA.1 hypothetical protein
MSVDAYYERPLLHRYCENLAASLCSRASLLAALDVSRSSRAPTTRGSSRPATTVDKKMVDVRHVARAVSHECVRKAVSRMEFATVAKIMCRNASRKAAFLQADDVYAKERPAEPVFKVRRTGNFDYSAAKAVANRVMSASMRNAGLRLNRPLRNSARNDANYPLGKAPLLSKTAVLKASSVSGRRAAMSVDSSQVANLESHRGSLRMGVTFSEPNSATQSQPQPQPQSSPPPPRLPSNRFVQMAAISTPGEDASAPMVIDAGKLVEEAAVMDASRLVEESDAEMRYMDAKKSAQTADHVKGVLEKEEQQDVDMQDSSQAQVAQGPPSTRWYIFEDFVKAVLPSIVQPFFLHILGIFHLTSGSRS